MELPCPIPAGDLAAAGAGGRDGRSGAAPAYVVAVRLLPVEGCPGCWALHIVPRFVVYNALRVGGTLRDVARGTVEKHLLNLVRHDYTV